MLPNIHIDSTFVGAGGGNPNKMDASSLMSGAQGMSAGASKVNGGGGSSGGSGGSSASSGGSSMFNPMNMMSGGTSGGSSGGTGGPMNMMNSMTGSSGTGTRTADLSGSSGFYFLMNYFPAWYFPSFLACLCFTLLSRSMSI